MWGRIKPSDAQVVHTVLSGRSNDYGLLVRRYLGLAHAVAFSYAGNPEDAEDIVQEAFLKAYRSLHTLREPRRFGGWLVPIVRNAALDFLENRPNTAGTAATSLPSRRRTGRR